MGAWNCSLIGNDAVQDEVDFLKMTDDPTLFISNLYTKACRESLDEDEALKWLEPGDEEPELETEKREIFLGVVYSALQHKKFQKSVSKTQIENALNFIKELSHKRHLSPWSQPDERLNELHSAYKEISGHLKSKK